MITIAVAGLGSRGRTTYAKAISESGGRAKVVAIADTNEAILNLSGDELGIPSDKRFSSAEAMLREPKLADALFICTQDRDHVPQALLGLEKGYDILLEKPISPKIEELYALREKARGCRQKVVVCHVLRYTPFFGKIKEIIDSGAIGRIVNIQALENVRYWHQAHSFVRGNWRSQEQTSPMILAKCCHDLDYLIWLTSKRCISVSSFGSLFFFKKENAPKGAAKRCLDGCLAKDSCPYDAEKIYLTNDGTGVLKGNTGWPCDVLDPDPNPQTIRKAIEEGPYGRCVFFCDNDVVDNQVVSMNMEDSSTLSLTMSAFTSTGGRTIKVMGTLGDIWADMDKNIIIFTVFGEEPVAIDVTKLSKDLSGHGGGDSRLVSEFLDLVEGKPAGPSITTLEASIQSHLIALAAERSRLEDGKVIDI